MNKLKSPIAVVWEITNNCNYKCPHCRAYMSNFSEDVNLENKIIEKIIENDILSVNISGGEPLVNPRIVSIVSRLTKANIDVGISSNGWLFSKIGKELVDNGLSFLQVSLDGPKELHDSFRGVDGAYERAIEALKYAKSLGLRTQMNVTITSRNLSTLMYNLDVANEIGIDRIFYRRVVPAGKGKENISLLPPKEEYLRKILELSKIHSETLDIAIDDPILPILMMKDGANVNNDRMSCTAGVKSIGIDSNGVVYPCIFLREKIGDFHEDDFSTIWNNSPILEKLRNRDFYKCGKCEFNYICGGCRAYSGIFEKDEMCPL